MRRSDIPELHFITYITNVPSILRLGIVSRNRASRRNTDFDDVSEPGVQERRAAKKVPGTSKHLHDYTNLYFDAHNPMLSARRAKNNKICVLRINKDVLDLEGVIVTDKNAARECWFKSVDEGLPLLEKDEIYATFWLHDDYLEEERHKGIKCAEILVPECVESRYIIGAYVSNQTALNAFKSISKNPEGAEFHGFQSVGEWGFARRASSEARSEELSSATDFSPWVSTLQVDIKRNLFF